MLFFLLKSPSPYFPPARIICEPPFHVVMQSRIKFYYLNFHLYFTLYILKTTFYSLFLLLAWFVSFETAPKILQLPVFIRSNKWLRHKPCCSPPSHACATSLLSGVPISDHTNSAARHRPSNRGFHGSLIYYFSLWCWERIIHRPSNRGFHGSLITVFCLGLRTQAGWYWDVPYYIHRPSNRGLHGFLI